MNDARSNDALIVVSQVTKVFQPLQLRIKSLQPIRRKPAVRALHAVSVTVRRGEILGLLGANGAGKTTLLKILATLILPTEGHATIAGHDVVRDAAQIKPLIGLVAPDDRSFYWRLTGRQNLEFFATFYGLTPTRMARRIDELQEHLGLDALDRRFGLYSTGMRHRLGLARGLLHDPQILLLDEPTRSVDPLAAAKLHQLIKDRLVRQRQRTAIIATHNLHEAEALCDRIAILHEGTLVGCGTLEELRRQQGHPDLTLIEMMEQLTSAPSNSHG